MSAQNAAFRLHPENVVVVNDGFGRPVNHTLIVGAVTYDERYIYDADPPRESYGVEFWVEGA